MVHRQARPQYLSHSPGPVSGPVGVPRAAIHHASTWVVPGLLRSPASTQEGQEYRLTGLSLVNQWLAHDMIVDALVWGRSLHEPFLLHGHRPTYIHLACKCGKGPICCSDSCILDRCMVEVRPMGICTDRGDDYVQDPPWTDVACNLGRCPDHRVLVHLLLQGTSTAHQGRWVGVGPMHRMQF